MKNVFDNCGTWDTDKTSTEIIQSFGTMVDSLQTRQMLVPASSLLTPTESKVEIPAPTVTPSPPHLCVHQTRHLLNSSTWVKVYS